MCRRSFIKSLLSIFLLALFPKLLQKEIKVQEIQKVHLPNELGYVGITDYDMGVVYAPYIPYYMMEVNLLHTKSTIQN